MNKIGIDLGKFQSNICVMDNSFKIIERSKIRTRRVTLEKALSRYPGSEVAIESCRDSGWVHEHLTSLGYKVIVVDTTRARALGIGRGRRKTDQRDAEVLARALVAKVAPPAHILSREARQLRDSLSARDQLVRTRSRLVTTLRGQFQSRGWETPSCRTEVFADRLRASSIPGVKDAGVQCLLRVLDQINEEIKVMDQQLQHLSDKHEAFDRLCSVPGVKLIAGLAFIAAVDEAQRFDNARQVEAYLGLVPSENTTGGKQRLGRITRCGNSMARRMLVQAAQALLLARSARTDPLVVWALQVAERRGKSKAVIALARRLVGVLWAIWVDGSFYDPKGLARNIATGLSRRARRAEREALSMKTIELIQVEAGLTT